MFIAGSTLHAGRSNMSFGYNDRITSYLTIIVSRRFYRRNDTACPFPEDAKTPFGDKGGDRKPILCVALLLRGRPIRGRLVIIHAKAAKSGF
jgi:hypothetical protein